MDSTSIQYEAVKAAVDEIQAGSQAMSGLFDEFRAAMGRIYQEDVFEGEASESFNEKFTNLKKKFDSFVSKIHMSF